MDYRIDFTILTPTDVMRGSVKDKGNKLVFINFSMLPSNNRRTTTT